MEIKTLFKKIFWTLSIPFFPIIRDLTRFLGYNPYPTRQPYLLGHLLENKTAVDFKKYLLSLGFKKDRIAWKDSGEILSLRLLENFKYQYHLRLFVDREIRGHYELTPEYSPLDHLHDTETCEKREEFLKMLEGWITNEK